MSVESSGKAKNIFLAAIEIEMAVDREAFLQDTCREDESLRRRVDALILAHESPKSLLDGGPPNLGDVVATEPAVGLMEVERPGMQIGPYKLRERLGVGGMGVVWAAEQKQPLRRKVALKLIKPGMDSSQIVARFEAEREALSLMDHPNIARVLDAGTTDLGRPYFVMELICGVPVTEYCDTNRLTIPKRVDLFMQVCMAVQHAHQKGIIHRDIKPSNVLVTLHDDRPVPKVIDFGVAKALRQPLTDHSVYTGVFQAIGTLAYMSPEQAQLSGLNVDTRADIYGLGVLLYELLTGVTPFDKKDLASAALDEACRMIREQEPPRPSTMFSSLGDRTALVSRERGTSVSELEKSICGDLDWIVMKALEKDRSRRYDTARSLVDDLQRLSRHEPVEASPPSLSYRMAKFARRNRSAVISVSVVFVAIVTGALLATVMFFKAKEETIGAKIARDQEHEARLEVERLNYWHGINLAYDAWNRGNRDRLQELMDELTTEKTTANLKGFEWPLLKRRLSDLDMARDLKVGDIVVTSLSYSKGGKLVAVGLINGDVRLVNAKSGHHLALPDEARGNFVLFSPSGSYFATAGRCEPLRLWRMPGFSQLKVFAEAGEPFVGQVAFSPDERLLAYGADGIVQVRDTETGSLLAEYKVSGVEPIFTMRLAFSPNGKQLAVSAGRCVTIYDWEKSREITSISHASEMTVVEFITDDCLLTGGEFGLTVWTVLPEHLRMRATMSVRATCSAVSSQRDLIAVGCSDYKVVVFDKEFRRIGRLLQSDFVNGIALSPDGTELAAGGRDNVVRVWPQDSWRSQSGVSVARSPDPSLAISNDGRIATFHDQEGQNSENGGCGQVRIWSPLFPEQGINIQVEGLSFRPLAFSGDGKYLAGGANTGEVLLWDSHSGELVVRWQAHDLANFRESYVATNMFGDLAFSPDNMFLVSGAYGPDLAIWNVEELIDGIVGEPDCPRGGDGWVSSVCFADDGRLAIAGGNQYRLGFHEIWKRVDGSWKTEGRAFEHPEWVRCIAFSPDGTMVALQDDFSAGVIHIYNASSGHRLAEFRGHSSKTVALTFTPDGRQLVTGSDDGFIRFWNIHYGRLSGSLQVEDRTRRLAFMPDNRSFVAVSWDGWLRLLSSAP